jgi:5-keto 4-deoxyuronate isomerase
VELAHFSWKTGGFDNIMMATFVIRNNNAFAVKDITIKCTHSAESGTEIDSNSRTIYEIIQPKKKRTIRDFNMGFIHNQAKRSRCQITGVVPAG